MGLDKTILNDTKPGLTSPLKRGTRGEAVIAIFDIGKTNKKLLLFNENYDVVHEVSEQLNETTDEDGFACEDVLALTHWIKNSFDDILNDDHYHVKAINFSAYGASFVYLGKELQIIPPLYNYLKPFSPQLQKQFYDTYGGESKISKETASPVLGNLNSGMQLYRLKYEKPQLFASINYALHLPQYVSFILSGKLNSDITSIGCHTNLWDFQQKKYHNWVMQENIAEKFPAILNCNSIAGYVNKTIALGAGLHDSSAALIPYLTSFQDPFILLSTGTWCITLNPFNHTQLSDYELHHDCLSYLSYEGKPVKASRLFAGYEHEQQTKKLSAFFNTPPDYYKTVNCNFEFLNKLKKVNVYAKKEDSDVMIQQSVFAKRDLTVFASYEEAYHQLIADIIAQQLHSTNLVLSGTNVKRIFVDGGFSKNPVFMQMLAQVYPGIEVYAASVAQASALGAALVMHSHWNNQPLPSDLIELKFYSSMQK